MLLLALVGAMTPSFACAGETNPPAAVVSTNSIADTNAAAIEAEFKKIMTLDEEAQTEVDRWIRDNQKFSEQGAGVPPEELNQKIRKRFQPVRDAYQGFVKRNPKHVEARLAYASFLNDIHDEDGEMEQLMAAKEIDPTRPSIWNNLANYHGHVGDVRLAFDYYQKAIELDPNEPVYYHNFGTTVYLFRRDAEAHWRINEQQVFDKALMLYSNTMRLDPTNFPIATDVAQSYYGIKPTRLEDALVAWTNAMKIATTELERQSVHIHFARTKLSGERFAESRAHMSHVNDPLLDELRARLNRNIELQEAQARTNAPVKTETNGAAVK